MIYKPPELLPEYFTYYCNLIIPLLPEQKEENNWVVKPWENIHLIARKIIIKFLEILLISFTNVKIIIINK